MKVPIQFLVLLVFIYEKVLSAANPEIFSIKQNLNILQCPQPSKAPDPIDKRSLGGQYYLNNEIDDFVIGFWINYQIPVDQNSANQDYGVFYFSSNTQDTTNSEINLRLLTVFFNEVTSGQNIKTKIQLQSFSDTLVTEIPQSLQNQWVYIAGSINLKQNRLELGIVYINKDSTETIVNVSTPISSTLNLSSLPNIGLYPLWMPIKELVCGQSSFYQNDSQLKVLSQVNESEVIGHFLLQSNRQVQSQFEQILLLLLFLLTKSNLNEQTSKVAIVSGFSQDQELKSDVHYQQMANFNNVYFPIIGNKNFFSIQQLNIENFMTLIFDYYSEKNADDVIFVSQSLTKTGLRMFAVSQLYSEQKLHLNITIEGSSIIFDTQLQAQSMMTVGLSIQCLPPFTKTVIDLRINTDTFEQKILSNICFNLQKTNKKVFIGYYDDISKVADQFKIVSNLIIVKGEIVSGILSQIERKNINRNIENCEYAIKKQNSNDFICLRCGGSYLLFNNKCVESQKCQILDEKTKIPQYSDKIANMCFVECSQRQIKKHNILCDYDFIQEDKIIIGSVNITSQTPSQVISNLPYTDTPQVFVALNGMTHDGTTQGYDYQIQTNNIQSSQFEINLVEGTQKIYTSFIVSYIAAPSNSHKIEIGQYTLSENDIVTQADANIKVYKVSFNSEKLYIPNVAVSILNYKGANNIIMLNIKTSKITYTEVPQYEGVIVTKVQYIALQGSFYEKEYTFTDKNINEWGTQPSTSTFRYLNMFNITMRERVDPNIQMFSMISGLIKSQESYEGIEVSIKNNTQTNGKFIVDYVQANKSSLTYFKSTLFFFYQTCDVAACLYSYFDDKNILASDTSLISLVDHPLLTGNGVRQYSQRIKFNKYFTSTPQIFLYYEQINIPEVSANEGIAFEYRPENINYDGFNLVYEVYNNFQLQSMSIKYFATENSNYQIDTVIVTQDQLSLQASDNVQFFSITKTFKSQFTSVPQVMISVFSYIGNQESKLRYNIQIDAVTTSNVTFKVQIMKGTLSQLKFQYIAAIHTQFNEIQSLQPISFEDTPIGKNFDITQLNDNGEQSGGRRQLEDQGESGDGQNNGNNQTPAQEVVVMNNWLTKYWDRWSVNSYQSLCTISLFSPNPHILYPIQKIELGQESLSDISLQVKGNTIKQSQTDFYYDFKFNVEREFLKTMSLSIMGTVKTCPDWCVQCNKYGTCLQCKYDTQKLPDCSCKDGYILDSTTNSCILCIDGCCKSDLKNSLCTSCKHSSLIKSLNCGCPTNQQRLYIAWKNQISLNVTLINGGDQDQFSLIGCSSCTQTKTGRTIILNSTESSADMFGVYSSILNSLGNVEYEVSILQPPQYVCYGSIKSEKIFMIGLPSSEASKATFNVDHLQNSMSFCSDRKSYSSDGDILLQTPISLNWQKKYFLKYQNNTYLLRDIAASQDLFMSQFTLSYTHQTITGSPPNILIKCEEYNFSKFGQYHNIKKGLNQEVIKSDADKALSIQKFTVFENGIIYNNQENIVIQGWFYLQNVESNKVYSLFDIISEDQKVKLGVQFTLNSILFSYENPPDSTYKISNFAIFNEQTIISDQWFYLSLEWLNGLTESQFTIKYTKKKGQTDTKVQVYKEKTAPFVFTSTNFLFSINAGNVFSGQQWTGYSMDFGFYKLLYTATSPENSIYLTGLNLADNIQVFQKTFSQILFYYEFTNYDFTSMDFIKDFSKNNNSFMDDSFLTGIEYKGGLKLISQRSLQLPPKFYVGKINEDYGFVVGLTLKIRSATPFEGSMMRIGHLNIRLAFSDNQSEMTSSASFYYLQFCVLEIECINSHVVRIPINSSNTFGLAIQIRRTYVGNQRLLSVSIYSETLSEQNIMFTSHDASTGFNSFSQTPEIDDKIFMKFGSQNNDFNDSQNYIQIRRFVVQSGSYIQPSDILIQSNTEESILTQSGSTTQSPSEQNKIIMLKRLQSLKCQVGVGKEQEEQICIKCNLNYENILGICVSNGECSSYQKISPYEKNAEQSGYYFDYTTKNCQPCNTNCRSCLYSSDNCTECAFGYVNIPKCKLCPYTNGSPTYFDPDTSSCLPQCSANYCTDTTNLVCIKCDKSVRRIFDDFNTLSNTYSGEVWMTQNIVQLDSTRKKVGTCFIKNYLLSFYGGGGSFDGATVVSKQITSIPLHHSIRLSYLLLVTKSDFDVNISSLQNVLAMKIDGNIISQVTIQPIITNQMLCSSKQLSSLYNVTTTISHISSKAILEIGFSFSSQSSSSSFWWGIRLFSTDILQCHFSCFTCYGPGESECLSCSDDLIFVFGKCVCPSETQYIKKKYSCWQNPCYTCETCEVPCSQCGIDGVCLSCIQGMKLFSGKCYSDCADVPANIRNSIALVNDPIKGFCVPFNVEEKITEFSKNELINQFKYTKLWSWTPIQTPGKYLLQCGSDNFVGQLSNSILTKQFSFVQPYYAISVSLEALFLNNWTNNQVINIKINDQQIQSVQYSNTNGLTPLNTCTSQSSAKIAQITTSKYSISVSQFTLSFTSSGFDGSVAWALRKFVITASVCPIYCSACNSLKQCTSCVEGAIIDGLSGVCYCPAGYISSLKWDCTVQPCGICIPCHQSCSRCSGLGPFKCTMCKEGFFKVGLRCVETCPQNYYLELADNNCYKCHDSCLNCLGPSQKNCISCYAPSILDNNRCVDSCSSNDKYKDSFARACIEKVTADNKIFLSDSNSFSTEISKIYTSSNPALNVLYYTCGNQLFAGPYNTQVVLNMHQVISHSQLKLTLDVLVSASTTLTFSSNQSFLTANFKQTINIQSTQSCSSQSVTTQKVIAYINSFEIYKTTDLYITVSSSNSPFSIKNIHFETIICSYQCLTCKGPNTNDCLSCTDGAALQSDGTCKCTKKDQFLMFIQGSLSRPINSECKKCRYPCTTCFGQDNYSCSSCEPGFYLKDYSCVTSCPPLKYQQLQDQWLCQKCSFPCNECSQDGKSCINCLDGFVLTLIKTCEKKCSDQQYIDNNQKCQMCDVSCYSCNGSNPENCIVCNEGFYRNQKTKLCEPCHDFCTECKDATNLNCSSCQDGIIHYNGTICTQDCSEISGTYPLEESCLQCDPECKRCDGPTFQNCLQCQDGKAISNDICTPCDPACTTCYGTSIETCYSCADGYFLQGNTCVTQCYSGYFGKDRVCIQCHKACNLCYGGSNDQCFSCNQGYYFFNNACLPCHAYCQICYGPLQTDCLYCAAGSYLLSNQCYGGNDQCPQNYYGDNLTRKCKQCDQSCKECSGSSQYLCLSCPDGSYMTNLIQNIDGNYLPSSCSKCPGVCQTCNSATQCTQCISNYYLYNGSCLIDCPSGYYENLYLGQCLTCINNCSTCEGYDSKGNFICTTCNSKYFLASDQSCQHCGEGCTTCKSATSCQKCQFGYVNYQGSCLTQCPIYYYPSATQECVSCIKPCSICTSPTMCQVCQVGYYLQKVMNQSNVVQSASCQKCHAICQDCVGPLITDCLSCKAPLSLQDGVCQQSCKKGYFSFKGVCYRCNDNCEDCTSSTNCVVCSYGYFSNNGVCQLCDEKCTSCFGSEDTQCNSCISPYYLYQSTCVLSCPSKFFKSSNQQFNQCKKCSTSCNDCFGDGQDKCSTCIDAYYLKSDNTCQSCSDTCKTCQNSSNNCTSCHLGQFLFNGTCLKTCPDTYYPDDQSGICQPCILPCETCSGPGSNQCIRCRESYFYSEGSCVACHDNCLSCYGVFSNECYTCKLGMKKDRDSCISCGDGKYYDNTLTSCQQCNSVCKTCFGGSFQNCLSCNAGKYLQDNKCNICPSSCSNCTSEDKCTSCVNGYYLLKLNSGSVVCIKQCPFGMSPNSQLSCDCTQNCSTCPVNSTTLAVSCSKCVNSNYVVNLYDPDSSYSCIDVSICKGYVDVMTQTCISECSQTTPFINTIAKQCLQNPCPSDTVIHYISGQGFCMKDCPLGFYANDSNICSPCHPLCQKCTGPIASQCSQCVDKVLFHPLINTCSDTCIVGYTQDTSTGYCVVCYTFCKVCIPNLVFLNGQCLEDCPVGYSQTAQNNCVQSSSQLVKIANKFTKPVKITQDVVLEANIFALGPVKSIEWVLRKSTDQEFMKSFELLSIDSPTLTIPYLALKASQLYHLRVEVILASKDTLNDEIQFTTSGEINKGSFVITPSSGEAGLTQFQISIDKYKYPMPLKFDVSYYVLELQYSNKQLDDGSLVKQTTPDFVKKGLVQIYNSVSYDQGQANVLSYIFPMNFVSDQNIACEVKIYSTEGQVEIFEYTILEIKKSKKINSSLLEYSDDKMKEATSFINYSFNLRKAFSIDETKLKAYQQNQSINLQIALSRKKKYNSKGQCDPDIDCFGQGTCINDSDQYSCSCNKGFLGVNCQWVDSDYLFLQTNVPKYIQYILSTQTSFSDIIIIQAIGNIFYYSDFNSEAVSLANLFLTLVSPKITDTLDQIQIQIYQTITNSLITIIQENFSSVASSQLDQLQQIAKSIKNIVSKNINMGESLSQETPTCDSVSKPISVQMIDATDSGNSSTPSGRRQLRRLQRLRRLRLLQTSAKKTIPLVFRELTVDIPPEVISTTKKVVVSGSSFKTDPRANPLAVTTTLSLSLGGSSGQQSVSDTPQPFILNIPKKVSSPPGMNTDAIQCTYYDEETNSFKSDGCAFVKETITNIICSCTHLTDFSAAFQPDLIKNAISLTDMKSAQELGNSMLASKTPSVITISSLPAPKIGQRNVNLINAVNIQMSGGVYNVLAKQVFIVAQDGEDYTTYNMYDNLNEESLEGLIKKAEESQAKVVVKESDNVQVGQFIVIAITIFGFLFKVGNRASFNFKFVEAKETLPENLLNDIHKNGGGQSSNQLDNDDSDEDQIQIKVQRNDNEYENSIVAITERNKLGSSSNSPREAVKMYQHDEVQEAQSNVQNSYVKKLRQQAKQDEVQKKTVILKKKYEQEKRLKQILESVNVSGQEEMQSQQEKVSKYKQTNDSPRNNLKSDFKQDRKQSVTTPQFGDQKPLNNHQTTKQSRFVKQTINHDEESQMDDVRKDQQKKEEVKQSKEAEKSKNPSKVMQKKLVFQKIDLSSQDGQGDIESVQPKKQDKKVKQSSNKKEEVKQIQQNEFNDNERVMTTEADDDSSLITPKNKQISDARKRSKSPKSPLQQKRLIDQSPTYPSKSSSSSKQHQFAQSSPRSKSPSPLSSPRQPLSSSQRKSPKSPLSPQAQKQSKNNKSPQSPSSPQTPQFEAAQKKSPHLMPHQYQTNLPSRFQRMTVSSQNHVGQSFESMKLSGNNLKVSNISNNAVQTRGRSDTQQQKDLKVSNLSTSQGIRKSSLIQDSKYKFQQEQIQNELAILRMRENIQKQQQKITSKNINPIYSIFRAKETLFQTKMSRMLYFFITYYGYLAFDFFIYKWGKQNLREEPFINYLFFFNPYRIILIVMLSNATSHAFLGFINHIFSKFVKKLRYEQITIKMLNKLRSHHLLCYICMFLALYAVYTHILFQFGQTKYFTIAEVKEILLETIAAQIVDLFIFDGFLVLFHMVFIDLLPDEMPLKDSFETFQSQRGFFYTKKTEHDKVLDLIL